MALSLFRRRKETLFKLLWAPSGEEFITTDLPVYNRHTIGTELFEEVDRLAFYYPVSPTLALLIDPDAASHGIAEHHLTGDEVRSLNLDMLSIAHEQAFATNEQLLQTLAADCNGAPADGNWEARGRDLP